MKVSLLVGLICIASSSISVAGDITRSYTCSYENKKRHTAGDLEIRLKGQEVRLLRYGNFTDGQPGMPGYKCALELERPIRESEWAQASDGLQELRWTATGNMTNVEIRRPHLPGRDVVTLKRDSAGFLVDMRDAGHVLLCGAGSSLPESVYLSLKNKACKVKFWSY